MCGTGLSLAYVTGHRYFNISTAHSPLLPQHAHCRSNFETCPGLLNRCPTPNGQRSRLRNGVRKYRQSKPSWLTSHFGAELAYSRLSLRQADDANQVQSFSATEATTTHAIRRQHFVVLSTFEFRRLKVSGRQHIAMRWRLMYIKLTCTPAFDAVVYAQIGHYTNTFPSPDALCRP
jgi:hypothetical protein